MLMQSQSVVCALSAKHGYAYPLWYWIHQFPKNAECIH